jgi:CxxC motif-containing protein
MKQNITKTLTCIECPQSCALTVDIENNKVIKVEGGKCPKGEKYAVFEVENPVRILTSTVLTKGLSLKILPVKTNKPIPKSKIIQAAEAIKKIKITKPVGLGDIIVENFLNLGVNLIATRGTD